MAPTSRSYSSRLGTYVPLAASGRASSRSAQGSCIAAASRCRRVPRRPCSSAVRSIVPADVHGCSPTAVARRRLGLRSPRRRADRRVGTSARARPRTRPPPPPLSAPPRARPASRTETVAAAASSASHRDSVEAVAGAPDRDDVPRLGGIGLDLLAQPAHVRRHGAAVTKRSPDKLEQVVAAEHLPRMLDEHPQQCELARRQTHLAALDRYRMRAQVDL